MAPEFLSEECCFVLILISMHIYESHFLTCAFMRKLGRFGAMSPRAVTPKPPKLRKNAQVRLSVDFLIHNGLTEESR